MKHIDVYGRAWDLPRDEWCRVCGQPDNCGDCTHGPLTETEARDLGAIVGKEFPMPGTEVAGRTVVASCYYRESDDELVAAGVLGDMYLVLLLNSEPPFFTVMVCYRSTPATSSVMGWHVDQRQDHFNIVPAINGDGPGKPGYIDMGGDY